MISRRALLGAAILVPFEGLAQTCGKLTDPQTEGPFFKTNSPQRISLIEEGAKGSLVVTGVVLSAQCKPVGGALLDFWHSDEQGAYDNRAFRYRGHQFADAQGRYRLETIVPAVYPGRTRHIHVKVQAPGRRALTTQLYFAGEVGNARDGQFEPGLAMRMPNPGEGRFDFVVEA